MSPCFFATFDGNNHTISNLYIDRSSIYFGRFGAASNSEMGNVGLLDILYPSGFKVD